MTDTDTNAPNPFAQFDHLRMGAMTSNLADAQPAAGAAPAENPFAQFDHLRMNAQPAQSKDSSPTIGSIARQVPTGFNEALADIIGGPVDAVTQGLNNDIRDINWAARKFGYGTEDAPLIGNIKNPFGGSETVKHAMAAAGVPNPDDLPAKNTAERIARGAGGGVAGMIAPELAGASVAKIAPAAGEVLGGLFGRSGSVGDLASSAAIGGSAGATGQTAAELAPEKFKPAASVVGNLVGGGSAALATQLPRAIAEGARSVRDYASPLTQAGQQATAGKILRDRASSAADLLDTLETGAHELVPGSTPTTFQLTGDMGLGSLEREVQTRNPADFQQRRADQNAARVDALQGVQPVGKPEELSGFLRTRLAEIDNAGDAAVENATRDAQAAAAGIGGHQSPDYYGAQIQGQIAPRQAQLMQDAQAAVRRIGGEGSPEGYGGSLRSTIQSAEDAARAHEEDLWAAIDPSNSLTVSMQPVQAAAQRVYGNLSAAEAANLDAAERTFLRVIDGYQTTEPFNQLAGLRTELSAAMRKEQRANGRTPAYARMTNLRGAVEDSIANTVEQRAALEADAVARGEMSPATTIEANLRAEQNEWIRRQAGTGANSGESVERNAAIGSSGFSRSSRAQVSGRSRSFDAPRDQGLSGSRQAFSVSGAGINHPSAPSLLEFLASKGGLGPDAELDAIGASNHVVGVDGVGRRRLVKQGGFPLDYAREAAEEAGYLQGGSNGTSTPRDFLDAIDAEIRGQKRYPAGYEGQEPRRVALARSERDQHEYNQYRQGLESDLNAAGHGQLAGDLKARALQIMERERLAPDAAVERAFGELEQEDLARHADFPGDRPRSVPGSNFDEAARKRLMAATYATRQRAQTFNQGPVGQVLRTNGTKGNYRSPDASVPAAIFKPGPQGFEAVQSFRNAVGNNTDALNALRNFAAASLRREAERPDGTLDPKRFGAWWGKHQDALRAVSEVRNAFSSAAKASEAMHSFTPFRPDLAPSTVPEQFFHSGPSGFEGVNQLRSLIGDQHAVPILSDYATSQLRKAAMRPDGVLDPGRFARWQASHADALRALPGLADRFATAAKATDAIEQAAVARRQAVDDFQVGAVGKLLGHTEPADTVREVGAIFGRSDAAAAMTRLAEVARQNPGAIDGLRKAVANFMQSRFVSNTEAATSGQDLIKPVSFQTFMRENEPALKAIFSTEEVNVLKAIAMDLKRSNRSLNAVRIPGQSNTAQDTIKAIDGKPSGGLSLLSKLVGAAGAGYGAYGTPGAVTGALGVLGQNVLSTARAAGLAKVDDLVKQALLDPELAKVLLKAAPDHPSTGSALKLAQQLRRLMAVEAAQANGQQQ